MKCSSAMSLVFLLTLTISASKYCDFENFPNPTHAQQFTFTPHGSLLILYGNKNRSTTVYNTSTWQPVSDQALASFKEIPEYLEYFSQPYYPLNFIYSSYGSVRAKVVTEQTSEVFDFVLMQNQSQSKHIELLTHSQQDMLYAFFYEKSGMIYVGNLTKSNALVASIDFSTNGPLRSLKWRPGTTEFVISGGTQDKTNYFIKYNMATRTLQDWKLIRYLYVMDFAFSPKGDIIYFTEYRVPDFGFESIIWEYNLATKVKKYFVGVDVNDSFLKVEVNGDYISGMSYSKEYIWRISDRTFMGSYDNGSKLRKSCLSPDGTYFINIIPNELNKFYVKKICNSDNKASNLREAADVMQTQQ